MSVTVYKGGKGIALYTVVIGNHVFKMCANPLHSTGINQFVGMKKELDSQSFGDIVTYEQIPSEVRDAIRQKLNK